MSRERSEGKTGIGGSRRVGSALFEKNIISVEYVKLKLLVALFAAIYLSVPHLSHAAPVDELLDVPVRVVGPDGNDVPGAELLFRGDNLGVTSGEWISAPQTMRVANGADLLVNARILDAGLQRLINEIQIVEGRSLTKNLSTNTFTSDATPGTTEILFFFDAFYGMIFSE